MEKLSEVTVLAIYCSYYSKTAKQYAEMFCRLSGINSSQNKEEIIKAASIGLEIIGAPEQTECGDIFTPIPDAIKKLDWLIEKYNHRMSNGWTRSAKQLENSIEKLKNRIGNAKVSEVNQNQIGYVGTTGVDEKYINKLNKMSDFKRKLRMKEKEYIGALGNKEERNSLEKQIEDLRNEIYSIKDE